MTKWQDRKGFTLTELLVVVAVVLILMSLLVVCVDGLYTYAMQLKCQHRMEQIWQACLTYATNHRGLLPAAWDFENNQPWYETLIATKHIDNRDALACPSSDLATAAGSGQAYVGHPINVTDVQQSIRDALRYLKARQDPSTGQWPHGGVYHGQPFGLNGLAVLALLGNGVTLDDPEFGDTLRKGIQAMMNQVHTTGDGTFGQTRGDGSLGSKYFTYHQSACLLALCDAARTMPNLELEMNDGTYRKLIDIAQEAFTHLIDTELNQYGGFVYHRNTTHNSCGDYSGLNSGDTSASGWCWQAIGLAKQIGLDPSQATDDTETSYTWDSIQEAAKNFLECCVPTTSGTPGTGTYYPCTPYWWYYNKLEGSCRWTGFAGRGHVSPSLPPGRWLFTACSLAERLMWGYTLDPSAPYGTIERDGYEQLQWLTENDRYLKHAKREAGTYSDGAAYYSQDLYMIYYISLALNKLRGAEWEAWLNVWPDQAMNVLQENTGDYTAIYGKGSFPDWCVAYPYSNGIFQTSMGAMSLEMCIADVLPGTRWGGVSAPGQYSYGYNKLIANEDYRYRRPSGDTIILMDYLLSGIDAEDGPELIAPRHGGKANVLFADGHVEALTVEDLTQPNTEGELRIKEHMLSLQPGTEPIPEDEEE